MKRTIFPLLAIALIVTVTGIQSCESSKSAASAKMLKFNYEKGKGYDYEMDMTMDQDIAGQSIKMDMNAYYSITVDKVEGAVKTMKVRYERFKMNMDIPGFALDIDTDKPVPAGDDNSDGKNPMQMMNRVFGAIKGQEFTMKVNEEGKVLEVSGFKTMADSIVNAMGGDEQMREKMREGFSRQFNDESAASQFERLFYIFPNKNVKVGDTWQKSSDLGGTMPGKYVSNYTVKEIEGDMVTLEEKSDFSKAGTEGVTGTVKGTLIVDSRTGLLVKGDQAMNLNTEANGMKMEIKMNMNTKGKAL